MSNPEDQDVDVEFANAFNEGEDGPGLTQEEGAPGAEAGEEAPAGDELAGDSGQASGGAPDAPGVAVVLNTETAPAEGSAPMTPEEIEKERQRLKSWEGRIKAREAELQAKPAEAEGGQAADELEDVADAAKAAGSTDLAQAAAAAAEAVEAGEISPDEAVAQLAEDFGEDFVKMIRMVVASETRKGVEPLAKKVDDVASTVNNKAAEAHFKAIATKHPDYAEIGESSEFADFIKSLPDDVRGEAEQVAKAGSKDEVIALLDAYKQSKQAAATPGPAEADTQAASQPAADELEGVRSGGVRIPEKPAPASGDFESAWESF
jgi:hypothetical protein